MPPANVPPDLKHPLVEMCQVAAPTVVTMASYTVMQFIDAQMVSRIGPIRDILRIGWPAGVVFANEMICWWWLMSQLVPLAGTVAAVAGGAVAGGPEARAAGVIANSAGWIALRYLHVSFMPAVGLSIAVTAIVGRCLGMNRADLAARRTGLGLAITMVYMGLCAVVFVRYRTWMILQFIAPETDPQTVQQLVAAGSAIMIAATSGRNVNDSPV